MRLALTLAALILVAAAPPTKRLSVTLPDGEGLLPERYGVSADAANSNCLACHSAAMITAQPRLTRVQWGETIAKMRNVYGAPIDPADDKAILDWLVAD
ncbi:cytochrome c [Sandarakinorhabdus oryzae]|uniref:cytochrome c n=1 Tax=Sandarakinorhabdus oryzae TaxID=2675220 RepID=UPI0012E13051|nr:cytochrome c [Sandarakinorhabdus oryzae]